MKPRGCTGGAYSPLNPDMTPRERNRTRHQTAAAIKAGRLIKPDACQDCGRTDRRIEVHHPDYRKPLEVMWLCRWCHWNEHRRIAELANFGTERQARNIREKIAAEHRAEWLRLREKMRPLWEADEAARQERKREIAERKQVIADMVAAGASVTEIAIRIDRSLSATSHFMRRNGLRRAA